MGALNFPPLCRETPVSRTADVTSYASVVDVYLHLFHFSRNFIKLIEIFLADVLLGHNISFRELDQFPHGLQTVEWGRALEAPLVVVETRVPFFQNMLFCLVVPLCYVYP